MATPVQYSSTHSKIKIKTREKIFDLKKLPPTTLSPRAVFNVSTALTDSFGNARMPPTPTESIERENIWFATLSYLTRIIWKSASSETEARTEYTECWPCSLYDILFNKHFPAG
jgi:hypothetical protein